MNSYHKNIVFVPGCLFAPMFQACNIEKNRTWTQDWLNCLSQIGCNIIPMPCPESSFDSPECGLGRKPHGIDFYELLPGFWQYCSALSVSVAESICIFTQNSYKVLAILGIEHSPTCAASYMYTHQGMKKRSGIFISELKDELEKIGIYVPVIGINRRYPKKSITKFLELLDEQNKNVERRK